MDARNLYVVTYIYHGSFFLIGVADCETRANDMQQTSAFKDSGGFFKVTQTFMNDLKDRAIFKDWE